MIDVFSGPVESRHTHATFSLSEWLLPKDRPLTRLTEQTQDVELLEAADEKSGSITPFTLIPFRYLPCQRVLHIIMASLISMT